MGSGGGQADRGGARLHNALPPEPPYRGQPAFLGELPTRRSHAGTLHAMDFEA
jgi:hypothetical protein